MQYPIMAKLLIIGTIPPPIGGVAMHVRRLTQALRRSGFDFDLCDLRTASLSDIFSAIVTHRNMHVHISNPAAQLALVVFCRLTFKKLIITYHGCWGRYGAWGNWAVKLSALLAHVPIVQERAGLLQALRCNPRSRLISTYIPDPYIQPLPVSLQVAILLRRNHYQVTFCTNAWNVTFDKNGREIYGISEMITRFADYPEYQLLISDPSANYRSYIQQCSTHITDNIFFINQLHDFQSILLLSDAFIRNTSTDGVSLSIHEARELGIPVLASATVVRPPFCGVFQNILITDLKEKLEEARRLISLPGEVSDTISELIKLYEEVV